MLERGLLVENYHIHTTPCTPSRSTIFQGHHTQQTGLFLNSDNAPYPVAAEDMPTPGHMMQAAGYYTSYKGKWHLSRINYERSAEHTSELQSLMRISNDRFCMKT